MTSVTLIAENNPPVFYLLKTYAQMCGFQTIQAEVGDRALEIARYLKPAFILLNIDLPGTVRGWDVLSCLKSEADTHAIPVVVYHLDEDPEREHIGDADACLPIPVLYEAFKETLARAGVELHETSGSPAPLPERRSSRRKKL
jgi:CheY-like chemotaxis protein